MEKGRGIELSDAVSWFKRKQNECSKNIYNKPLVCYNYIVKWGTKKMI